MDSPIIQATQRAVTAITRGPRATFAGSSTDSNIAMSLGIPAVTIGGGGEGGNWHSRNEWYKPIDAWMGPQNALLTVLMLSARRRDQAGATGAGREVAASGRDARKRQFADEALGLPVPVDTAAEHADHAVDRADAETDPGGRGDSGPPRLSSAATASRTASVCQLISILPEDFDSEPYLAALVASSCTDTAIACASAAGSVMSSPRISDALLIVPRIWPKLFLDDGLDARAGPARHREQLLHIGERAQAALKRRLEFFRRYRPWSGAASPGSPRADCWRGDRPPGSTTSSALRPACGGNVDEHIDGADQRAVLVAQRGRIGRKADPRTVGPLGDRLDVADGPVFLDGDGHRTSSWASGVPSGQNSFQVTHHNSPSSACGRRIRRRRG